MDPDEDSECMIGREKIASGYYAGQSQTNYVAYFNQRLKVVTVIDIGNSCTKTNVYFAGKLSKIEVFDNKLFALVNGKPMFFNNKADLSELLSQNSNSYKKGTASIIDIQASVDGKTINLTRQQSKNSETTQLIKIEAKDITGNRVQAVEASQYVRAYVKEIRDYANVVR